MNEFTNKLTDFKSVYKNNGYISYKFSDDIFFKIAKLSYELFEDESFQYIFTPYYDVLDAFDSLDIPGIDLKMRLPEYIRTNLTPVFVSERIPPRNRINLREELKENNMDYYQPFLLLLNSKKTYGGDRLFLKDEEFFNRQFKKTKETNDIYKTISYLLRKLATRISLQIGDLKVTEKNRADLIKNYIYLYNKVRIYYDNKSKGNQGRKKQIVSSIVLEEIRNQYVHGIITIDEAVQKSGLGSRKTFYRRLNEMQNNNRKK